MDFNLMDSRKKIPIIDMTKKELINYLTKIPGDDDVIVHCSYNNYEIRNIVDTGEFIVLVVGQTVNHMISDDTSDAA